MSEQSIATTKELLRTERQIMKVRAILAELETKRAGLIEALKG